MKAYCPHCEQPMPSEKRLLRVRNARAKAEAKKLARERKRLAEKEARAAAPLVLSGRRARIVAMAQAGALGSEIARVEGISRQRVSAILGVFQITKDKVTRKPRPLVPPGMGWRPAHDVAMRAYGIEYAEVRHLPTKVRRAYSAQKMNASTRGIEWRLNLKEWFEIWDASGHLSERGRGSEKYCMSRKGDSGPYSVGNVFIQKNRDNVLDWHERRRGNA